MEQCDNGFYIGTRRDPGHRGKHQLDLETKIVSDIEPINAILDSLGYGLVDFDQWGLTYISRDDPDLWVDLHGPDEYSCETRLVIHKDRLLERDIAVARDSLKRIYHQIIDKMTRPRNTPMWGQQTVG